MATPTQIRRRGRWSLILGTVFAFAAFAAVAYADNAVADGDGVSPVANNDMAFGSVSCNVATNKSAAIAISRQGAAGSTNVFKNGSTVTISVVSVTGTGLSASIGATNTITLPSDWGTKANGTMSNAVSSTITVNSSTEGPGSGSVEYRATGVNTSDVTITRQDTMNVTWTTGSCAPPNTAPTTPGAPTLAVGSATPNQGVFGLTWTASTDAESNPISYQLQHKDANDAGYSDVSGATALSSNSFAFTAPGEDEGTWDYKVRASDGALQSAYSAASAAIKVDKSAPNSPTAAATTAHVYTDGDGNKWWKGSVTVSFSDNGDPDLVDGSAGSGIDAATLSANQTFNTLGSHNASGSVKDNAGNVSAAGTLAVRVDDSNPTFDACPTGGPFTLNSGSQSVGPIAASDTGSGLNSAASTLSGSVDTSTVGTKTVTFTAKDNVGNEASLPCTYAVQYIFSGFLAPIDGLLRNSMKAGSTAPMKWQLKDAAGNFVSSLSAIVSSTSRVVACDTTTPEDSLEEYATGGTQLRYDSTSNQFIYNWQSPKKAGTCYKVTIGFNDGTSKTATFQLR